MFTDSLPPLAKSMVVAAIRVDDAQVQLGNAVINGSAERDEIVTAAIQTVRAARDASLIAALFLGGAPPELEEREGVPYSYPALVTLGWTHLKRAVKDTLPAAQASMLKIPGAGLEKLDEALSRLDAILLNSSPEEWFHAEPAVSPPRPDGSVPLFRPHGDYRVFARHNLSSYNYWHGFGQQWLDHFIVAPPNPRAFGESWRTYANCMTLQLQAAALVAGISTYHRWDAYDQACRVLTAHHLLCMAAEGEGAGQLYASCTMSWAEVSDDSEAFRSGLKQIADSQRHCWRAAREMMHIPGRCP